MIVFDLVVDGLLVLYLFVLVQLYTAYVESQEQLQLERLENKRVNKYLDDIVQEVEAKAPILKRQRDEHERMQKSVASLSAKLEQAVKVHNAMDGTFSITSDLLHLKFLSSFCMFMYINFRRCTVCRGSMMRPTSAPLSWKGITRGVNYSWQTWLSRWVHLLLPC